LPTLPVSSSAVSLFAPLSVFKVAFQVIEKSEFHPHNSRSRRGVGFKAPAGSHWPHFAVSAGGKICLEVRSPQMTKTALGKTAAGESIWDPSLRIELARRSLHGRLPPLIAAPKHPQLGKSRFFAATHF
jgi:hypothetical protein